jgi:hypothetical protein
MFLMLKNGIKKLSIELIIQTIAKETINIP